MGRAADNTIELQDSAVSSHHAVIRRMPSGEYLIQDLESSNGTYVAGVRIRAKKLDEGDEICMGGVVLRFTERSPMPAGLTSRPIATPAPELESSRSESEPSTGRMPLKTVSMTVSGEMPAVKPIWERNAEETVDFAALEKGKSTNLEADFAKLQTAYELIRSIAGHDDLDTILDSIVTTVLEKLDVDRAAILIASAQGPLVPRVAKKRGDSNDDEFTVSTSILNYVIEKRKAVVIDDLVMDSRFAGSKSLIMQAVRAAMCVPMLHNGQLVGVIHMDSTLSQTSLDEKHLDLMTTIANTAAFAVKTALLKEQITHMERERAEAISAMISGASHFINNPLAVVRSNMGMFEEWSESLTRFHSELAR